ncbi:hypothetical protein [Spiroplasma endosymbiont of Stenodema calcarata]|uniref:hypothetical protein n=1 Tax=Spiroplasma endosymbiont of Stenodema calcarata TaxID=3139328 RepID=UPI003CCACEAF
MFNFNNEKLNQLVVSYINYNIDPKHEKDVQITKLDNNNSFYQIDTRKIKDSINGVISSHLATSEQFAKAGEIIDEFYVEKTPFVWCTITIDNSQGERSFFEKSGLTHLRTGNGMLMDLTSFTITTEPLENEKFITATDLEAIKEINDTKITSANNLKIINDKDLPLKDLPTPAFNDNFEQACNLCYVATLTKDDVPIVTGIIYFEAEIAVIGEIICHDDNDSNNEQKMLIHLLTQAQKANYKNVGIVTPIEKITAYQQLGFEPQDLYFNTYVMHYSK